MKAVQESFARWQTYATIITFIFVALIHDAQVGVYGFQNSNFNADQQLNCRSRRSTSAGTTTWKNPLVSQAITLNNPNHSSPRVSQRTKNRLGRTILSMASIPTLDKWKIISSGSVIGTVRGHPAIDDGDVITTSPIRNPDLARRLKTVTTSSGSKYKLLEPRGEISAAAKKREAAALAAALAQADKAEANANSNNNNNAWQTNQQSSSPGKQNFWGGWSGPFKKVSENIKVNGSTNAATTEESAEARRKQLLRSSPEWEEATRNYNLNGDTIGLEDEYLLANRPERSTSGKSNIWEAFKTDESRGLPLANKAPVCMKVSTNLEAISREYENYRKLSFLGIWETGRFVRCYEFFPVAGYDIRYRNQCALAMEKGSSDLKKFLNGKGRLQKKELRDACMAATQCVQALHSAGLVWTDMKTENFVVMNNGEVKGIDLESAMPIGDYPVDYSPEACPPEFASAFLNGDGPYFELRPSYDIWSLGMLMLELSSGRGYFDGKTPAQITKELRDIDDASMARDLEGFECEDARLKDLIKRCLRKDSTRRPNADRILMHPYFMAGNPFAFLSR